MFKQAYGIHNKIEWLLVNKYDELRRDENGTVQYEKASAQKISNLLSCPELDTKENSEYSDYIYDLLNTEQLSKQYVQLTEGEYTGEPKYVGDLLKTEIWSRWAPGENVFISAVSVSPYYCAHLMPVKQHCGFPSGVILVFRLTISG